MSVAIRRATKDDINNIAALEKEAIICPWSEKVLFESLENENTFLFVAEKLGCFCGYAGARVILDEAEVYNIAVSTSARRAGVGKKLLDSIIAESKSRGAVKLFLEVAENNPCAIALYEKNGFKKIYTRKNYYNNVAAYVYEKQL